MGKQTGIDSIEVWRAHIENWKRSGQTQADYCGLNGLSTASFSKWKKKLNPKLSASNKTYKPKNRYSKNTKLNDAQYEALVDAFFTQNSLHETSAALGISIKTIRRIYEELKTETIDGALQYPHLFCGAGTLLLLCPPPDVTERMVQYRHDFPNQNYTYRDEHTREGRLRNNIEFVYRLLISYTGYQWTLAETFVFRELGLKLFYDNSFFPLETKPEQWSIELYYQLASDINLITALRANMDIWATEDEMQSPFSDVWWRRVFQNRTRVEFNHKWAAQMAHDLKWCLNHARARGVKRQRNKYWDEYAPSEGDVQDVKRSFHIGWV